MAVGLLAGAAAFLLINFGNNKDSKAAVTISSFNAALQPDTRSVLLTWTTSAELNNAYFDLERSSNGVDFEMISEQPGQGTSINSYNYEFVDLHPMPSVNRYRLKQTDFDGTITYGPVREVVLEDNVTAVRNTTSGSLKVFPNPSTGIFNVSDLQTSGMSGNAAVAVFDYRGRLVLKQLFNNASQKQLDLSLQPPGAYILQILDANNERETRQLIIQR